MDLKKTRTKYLKYTILVVLLCVLLGAVSACVPSRLSLPDTLNESAIDNAAITVTTNSTDKLGEFQDGFTYVYTNKDLIDDFRDGKINDDTSKQVVNTTTAGRGTIANPYVIASGAHWEEFARQMESDANHGKNKYYVLGADIDFDVEDFYPIRYFNGTFYGLGHTLSNITVSSWKYLPATGNTLIDIADSTSVGFGMFCNVTDAVITDLIVDNFDYKGMPKLTPSVNSQRAGLFGGIVGESRGTDYVLNCHTSGKIYWDKTDSVAYGMSGIVGGMYKALSKSIKIYRCSTNLNVEAVKDMTATKTGGMPMVGAMLGDGYNGAVKTDAYIYDCVAKMTVDASTYDNGRANMNARTAFQGENKMENIICEIESDFVEGPTGGVLAGTMANSKIDAKNCYLEGRAGALGSANQTYQRAATGSAKITSAENINVVKGASGYSDLIGNETDSFSEISGQPNEVSTKDKLLSDATDFFTSNFNQIWDVSKIGGYDPDTTPVRNYLYAYVNYRNLINGGRSEEAVGIDDGKAYKVGNALESSPSATYLGSKSSNQVFKGWTDDETGKSTPFTTLPQGMYGTVKLYAVWELPKTHIDDYIDPTLTAKVGSALQDEITYDSVTAITVDGTVKYTGSSVGGFSTPKVTYHWTKDGKDRDDIKTATYDAYEVADSGDYTYSFRIQDADQPLWFYDGSCADTQTITIKPGELQLKSFNLDTSVAKPYYGRPISELQYTIKVENGSNIEVELASSGWVDSYATVDVKGTNTKQMSVVPTDTANYKSSYDIDVEFDFEQLYLIFKMAELSNRELKVEVEYGQNYGTNEIIYEFNNVYLDALANNPAFSSVASRGMLPYLANADELEADSAYKGAPLVPDSTSAPLYSAGNRYNGINKEHIITVFFKDATYLVKFASTYAWEDDKPDDQMLGYGKYIVRPDDPTYKEMLFLGWYFDDVVKDDAGNDVTVRRAWRFNSEIDDEGNTIPQDRVTKNTTLTAEFLNATDLEEVTVEISPDAGDFIALDTIKEGDLIVKAKYIGARDGVTVDRTVVVNWGKYDIIYGDGTPKTLKYVSGGMPIKVSVAFGVGDPVESEELKIPVQKKDITELTEHFNFGDKNGTITKEFDGQSKALPPISASQLDSLTGGQITSVEYEYTNILTGEVVSDPTKVGTYTVEVKYTTASDDLMAKSTILTLKIVTQQKVKVEWESNSLMYTGSEQHPVIAKVIDTETNLEVAVNPTDIEYTGDIDATAVGLNYKVSVSLGAAYKVVDGEECVFDITKAILSTPKYTSGTILYDGTEKNLANYLGKDFNPLLMEIRANGTATEVGTYRATVALTDTINCEWTDGSFGSQQIEWKIEPAMLYVNWDEWEFIYNDTDTFAPKITGLSGLVGSDSFDYDTEFVYKIYDADGNLLDGSEVDEIGSYRIVASFNTTQKNYILDNTTKSWDFVVVPKTGMTVLTIEWGETQFLYDGNTHYPTFVVKDINGNDVTSEVGEYLNFSDGYRTKKEIGTYSVKVTLKGAAAEEYFIRSGSVCKFKIVDENGWAPDEDETAKNEEQNNKDDDNGGAGGIDFDSIVNALKEYWQAIVSGVCIVLIIAFLAKAASYEGRRKRANKMADERYKAYYAAGAVGLFGWASSSWTIIAIVFIALTAVSFVIMLLAKGRCRKAEDSLAFAREDYEHSKADQEARQRDENMRMMFMSMMGGNAGGQAQGAYASGNGIGYEEMRGLISETVTALLPGVQQALPQQASVNDDVIKQIIKTQEDLAHNQELLMKKMSDQPAERVVEKEVVATTANDETIKQMMKTQENLMHNQEKLMEKILELSATQPQVQVIEKEVPIEKIVEKVVEVPVEKIVEKEVKVEVPVEKVVEKIVEKEVKVAAPAKPKKEVAPRLTLDEAYALLSKQQQKYFDGLKQYAMSKPGVKEKKSTYAITIGQSTVNPLLKLTIKKDMTVALFKMEDEYLKDIKRDATSDGTKVKVKETEVEIADAQACKVAKNMIDLREDQIERYNDLLKEQRAMNRKK